MDLKLIIIKNIKKTILSSKLVLEACFLIKNRCIKKLVEVNIISTPVFELKLLNYRILVKYMYLNGMILLKQ